MGEKKIKGFHLDKEGYYTKDEICGAPSESKNCMVCGNRLVAIYSEQYLKLRNGILMIMGLKVYGYECKFCNCGFSCKNLQ